MTRAVREPAMPSAHVIHITEPVTGGVGRQVELIAAALPQHGFRLGLILSLQRAPGYAVQAERFRKQGIEVDVIPMRRQLSPVRDLVSFFRIRRMLSRRQPDLVHTHASKAGMLGRRAARALGIPVVHTPHVFAFEWRRSGGLSFLYRVAERMAASWCERILLLSYEQCECAYSVGIRPLEKLTVLPNGVDCDYFAPATRLQREHARARFGLAHDIPVVGMAARFEPQKGVGHFLRAAASLCRRVERIHFLLVGEGSLLDDARGMIRQFGIEHAVSFCGNITHMRDFYHALDLFVLASLWEGCPYVILEAQASGVPVVATETCGSRALINDSETGMLVPVGDEAALARQVEQLLADRESAGRMAAWARAGIEKDFRLQDWSRQLAGVYTEILAENRLSGQ